MYGKTLIIVVFAFCTLLFVSNTNAQDSYTLDSVGARFITPTNTTASDKTTQPAKPQRNFGQVLHTLFGIGITGSYSYQRDVYGYGYAGQEQDVPRFAIDKGTFQDALVAIDFMTPIINYKHTFSFNYFSNADLDNVKYQKTHIDFLGLPRLGQYFDKYKSGHDMAERFTNWLKWLPVYDRRLVKTTNYTFDEMRIGGIYYNAMSYTRTKIHHEGASYKINGTAYNGFIVDMTHNKYTVLDTRGVTDMLILALFNNKRAGTNIEIPETLRKFLLPYYGKFPNYFINLSFFSNTNFTIKDKNGKTVYSDKSGSFYLDLDMGISYSYPIVIPKAHLVIIPDFMWQFFNLSTGDTMQHPYFYAGVGLQYYF